MKEKKEKKKREPMSPKKKVKIIIAVLAAVFVLCIIMISILNSVDDGGGDKERETLPPVHPSQLHETYEEDFDIMQYEEYLKFDRSIYLIDKHSGVTQSISPDDSELHGEGFAVLYEVILSIINGDSDTYNSYMGADFLKVGEFTQQQLYDIKIQREEGEGEYIFTVNYKIHENNGTYRNTIVSDVSRPQIFIINEDSLTVTDIIEQGYKK